MKFYPAILLCLFSLSCAGQEQAYQNPVDHKTYVAPEGWKSYTPKDGVKQSKEKVTIFGVRLLQDQYKMAARTTPAELASFIQVARGVASEVFAKYDKPATVLVQFTCIPGAHSVELASSGDPPKELMQSFYDKLMAMQQLRTTGEVKFQVSLQIAP